MINIIKEELRAWLRPISPLTAFAKSLRGEGEAAKPDVTPAQVFDFDFDELPTDIKEKIVAAKKSFEDQTTKLTQTEQRRLQAEDFARKQQSDASKAKAKLASHNIPLDGPAQVQPNSEDAKFQARVDRLVKDGLAEPQAKAYAKMLADEAKQQEAELLQRFAPLVHNVGGLQAQAALQNAANAFPHVFAIPELAKEINEAATYMLQAGNVPTPAAVQNLVEMAWGKHVLTNPDALKDTNKGNLEMNQPVPNFRSTMSQGSHTPPTRKEGDAPQAPRATQPETMAIMASVNAELRRGLPTKKGGK